MSIEKARSPGKGDRVDGNDSPGVIDSFTFQTFEGFRMVPDRLWLDSRLRANDIRLWCALIFTARSRNYTEATDAILAGQIGLSERSIRDSLARLEVSRFIDRQREGEGRVIRLRPEGDGTSVPGLEFRVVG